MYGVGIYSLHMSIRHAYDQSNWLKIKKGCDISEMEQNGEPHMLSHIEPRPTHTWIQCRIVAQVIDGSGISVV